jgi:recombination protein RecT
MSVPTNQLKDKLKNANESKAVAKKQPATISETIDSYLKRMGPQIARALPKHMNADRMARIALTTIRTTPKLLTCSIDSLMAAVMQSAQLGLEPGLLGHCYIIPYGKEAQFIIGYKGMIDLARRSGNIQSIAAHEVYQNDFLHLEYGLNEDLKHIPWYIREDQESTEPGDFRGAYVVAKFKDGGHQIHYMSKREIDEHRKRSKSGNNGPWVTDYVEMAKKTVVRSAWKWLPISVEIAQQVQASDETVKVDIAEDMSDVPTVDVSYANLGDSPAEQEQTTSDKEGYPEMYDFLSYIEKLVVEKGYDIEQFLGVLQEDIGVSDLGDVAQAYWKNLLKNTDKAISGLEEKYVTKYGVVA